MSYTPPAGDTLLFDWQGQSAYTPPAGDALEFSWGGLVVEPVWDAVVAAYRLDVTWSAIDGATDYRLRLLDAGGALLAEITTTGLSHSFTGLAAETTYQLELTGLDGATEVETLTAEATTPIGLPGGVTNLQHTFTADSLTFTWDAAADAEGYDLTLSRDGAEVASQAVTALTATFSGLEDSTQYDLAIQAANAQGGGPTASYQATTGYLPPAAPTNLRQFEERIIAVICRWDLAEPEKIHDVQVQLLYGDELLFDEIREDKPTDRTFVVPMASTAYLLRVRAGNPGGWSDWAEATVRSEKFPLIDSRLGVMGATYQERPLYPDTWDGGTDLSGVGDPQGMRMAPRFEIQQAAAMDTGVEQVSSQLHFSLGAIGSYLAVRRFQDEMAVSGAVTIGNFSSEVLNTRLYPVSNLAANAASVTLGNMSSVPKMFFIRPVEDATTSVSITLGSISSSIP